MMFFVSVDKPYIDHEGDISWQQTGQFVLSAVSGEKAAHAILRALPELPKEVRNRLDQKKYEGKKGYEVSVVAMIRHVRILEVPLFVKKEFFR